MKKYILATIKSWNIENFFNLQRRVPANWMIITDKTDLIPEKLKEFDPEYIFFPHWSWIIPEEIFGNFECIIFHMTDLPFGRGGSPLQNLIVRGIGETKISAIRCVKDLDAGPIYLKRDLSLEGSAEQIYRRASEIIFEDMIPFIINNQPEPVPQEGEIVSFKRRKPEQGDISQLATLHEVYDHIRMLDAEGYPRAFIQSKHFRFEFSEANLNGNNLTAKVNIIREENK